MFSGWAGTTFSFCCCCEAMVLVLLARMLGGRGKKGFSCVLKKKEKEKNRDGSLAGACYCFFLSLPAPILQLLSFSAMFTMFTMFTADIVDEGCRCLIKSHQCGGDHAYRGRRIINWHCPIQPRPAPPRCLAYQLQGPPPRRASPELGAAQLCESRLKTRDSRLETQAA